MKLLRYLVFSMDAVDVNTSKVLYHGKSFSTFYIEDELIFFSFNKTVLANFSIYSNIKVIFFFEFQI